MQRGRDMESNVGIEYIKYLNEIYNETFLGEFQREYGVSK